MFPYHQDHSTYLYIRGSHTTSESAFILQEWARGEAQLVVRRRGRFILLLPKVKKNSLFSILREWKFNLPLPSFTSLQLRFYFSSIFYLRFLVAADFGANTPTHSVNTLKDSFSIPKTIPKGCHNPLMNNVPRLAPENPQLRIFLRKIFILRGDVTTPNVYSLDNTYGDCVASLMSYTWATMTTRIRHFLWVFQTCHIY